MNEYKCTNSRFILIRDNKLVLRKKLEKLAQASNELAIIFDKLTDEIGVDEVYDMFL